MKHLCSHIEHATPFSPHRSSSTLFPHRACSTFVPKSSLQHSVHTSTMQNIVLTSSMQNIVPTSSMQRIVPTSSMQHTVSTSIMQHNDATSSMQYIVPISSMQYIVPTSSMQYIVLTSSISASEKLQVTTNGLGPRSYSGQTTRLPPKGFLVWESCRTTSLVGGFSRGSPVYPPLHSGAAPYSPRFTLIGSHDLDVKSHQNTATASGNNTAAGSPSDEAFCDATEMAIFSRPQATELKRCKQVVRDGGARGHTMLPNEIPLASGCGVGACIPPCFPPPLATHTTPRKYAVDQSIITATGRPSKEEGGCQGPTVEGMFDARDRHVPIYVLDHSIRRHPWPRTCVMAGTLRNDQQIHKREACKCPQITVPTEKTGKPLGTLIPRCVQTASGERPTWASPSSPYETVPDTNPYSSQSPSWALKTSMLRAVQISSLTHIIHGVICQRFYSKSVKKPRTDYDLRRERSLTETNRVTSRVAGSYKDLVYAALAGSLLFFRRSRVLFSAVMLSSYTALKLLSLYYNRNSCRACDTRQDLPNGSLEETSTCTSAAVEMYASVERTHSMKKREEMGDKRWVGSGHRRMAGSDGVATSCLARGQKPRSHYPHTTCQWQTSAAALHSYLISRAPVSHSPPQQPALTACTKEFFLEGGAAVAKRLACSPPTKANRVQSPAVGISLVSGFSRGSPISLAISFRRCSVLTLITRIGSQDLAVKSWPNLITLYSRDLDEIFRLAATSASYRIGVRELYWLEVVAHIAVRGRACVVPTEHHSEHRSRIRDRTISHISFNRLLNSGSYTVISLQPTSLELLSALEAEKRGSDKGDTATCLKCSITAKRKTCIRYSRNEYIFQTALCNAVRAQDTGGGREPQTAQFPPRYTKWRTLYPWFVLAGPTIVTIRYIVNTFTRLGSVKDKEHSGRPSVREGTAQRIQEAIERSPRTPTLRISRKLDAPPNTPGVHNCVHYAHVGNFWSVLHTAKLNDHWSHLESRDHGAWGDEIPRRHLAKTERPNQCVRIGRGVWTAASSER
ncbi:hypothetical protein PR048_009282 [Dryococelus australis]|uniref:Uncharacterized protein n=1 Tax=Dryococelus australis TaxID=614101 RepID=A0ABQ9I0E0_9NEOP|nr:hypothetical protein PR048_009282 [Dryococelus australis]